MACAAVVSERSVTDEGNLSGSVEYPVAGSRGLIALPPVPGSPRSTVRSAPEDVTDQSILRDLLIPVPVEPQLPSYTDTVPPDHTSRVVREGGYHGSRLGLVAGQQMEQLGGVRDRDSAGVARSDFALPLFAGRTVDRDIAVASCGGLALGTPNLLAPLFSSGNDGVTVACGGGCSPDNLLAPSV